MKIEIKKLHPDAALPERASEFAGGWDVKVTEIKRTTNELTGDFDLVTCKLGFALAIPKGYKLTIVPRSSITKTNWVIQNSPCLIDEDYRGEIMLKFRAFPDDIEMNYDSSAALLNYPGFPYEVGDRIAQCYLEAVIPIEFEEVEKLTDSVRGDGGFGSTGK